MRQLFLISVALLGVQTCFASYLYSIEDRFAKVNSYLTKEVNNDDISANMQAAASWLAKLEKKGFSLHRKSNQELKEALEMLLEVRRVSDSGNCDDTSNTLVDKIDKAVGKPRMVEVGMGLPMTMRVQSIVHHYAKKFYDSCYPENVSAKLDQVSEDSLKQAMILTKRMRASNTILEDESGGMILVQLIRNSVESREKGHENYQVTRDDFNKYVLEPCKQVKQAVGAESSNVIGWFKHYDMDPEKYHEAYTRREAAQNCLFIVDKEAKIWRDISNYSNQELRKEAEEELQKLNPNLRPKGDLRKVQNRVY